MTIQMTVNLPLEKARQNMLKYFETRDDIKVKSSETDSIQVRALGWWSPAPWMNIKIGMFKEENMTKLGLSFDFLMAYITITIAVVIVIAILWVTALTFPEGAGYSIGTVIGILATIPIAFALSIGKAKKKFQDDLQKAFDLMNKTS